MDIATNTLSGFIYSPVKKKVGSYYAVNGADCDGAMANNSTTYQGQSSASAFTNNYDNALGSYVRWDTGTTTGTNSGMFGGQGSNYSWSANQNTYLWVKFRAVQTHNCAIFFGFSDNPEGTENTSNPLNTSDNGIYFGFTSSFSSAWQVFQNDSTNRQTSDSVGQGNVDSVVHTLELWMNPGGTYNYRLDANAIQAFGSHTPSATTKMTWNFTIRNSSSSHFYLDIFGAYIQSDF